MKQARELASKAREIGKESQNPWVAQYADALETKISEISPS